MTEAVLGRATAPPSGVPGVVADTPLAVADLCKHYGPERPVLRNIGSSVAVGERVALIGPNGAGKSTLLRLCTRLIEPSSGRVHLPGSEITALPRQRLRATRARVGFAFQRHNLIPRLSVLSNVVHGALGRHAGPRLWWQGLAPRAVREAAMDCLAQVGLADLAGRRLALRDDNLLLDRPANAVDAGELQAVYS